MRYPSRFQLHTPKTVRASIKRLQSAKLTMSNDDFEELERKLGWTLDRARLLTEASVSKHIAIPDAAYFDPMHIFYVDGIFNHHVGLMMYELRKTAFNYDFVDAYVKLWRGQLL